MIEIVIPKGDRIRRRYVLEAFAKHYGWKSGAEIGVNNGETFFHMLDSCPDLKMIAVDSWAENEPYYGDLRPMAEKIKAKAVGYGDRARILHGDSTAMAREVDNGSLDFIFIDCDHSTEGVLGDLAAWRIKVKPGGHILGHDIDWPSVEKAVLKIFGEYKTLPDDVWMAP
jgi:predicted O-methyltransferase YrrM